MLNGTECRERIGVLCHEHVDAGQFTMRVPVIPPTAGVGTGNPQSYWLCQRRIAIRRALHAASFS